MNYYNPYMYTIPSSTIGTTGTVSKLTFSSFINGTSKTLNLINQAIPVFKQMSPVFKNVKTMFKVMNEFKKNDTNNNNNYNNYNNVKNYNNEDDGKPTFFI